MRRQINLYIVKQEQDMLLSIRQVHEDTSIYSMQYYHKNKLSSMYVTHMIDQWSIT
jgi:hypothetical protein